MARFLLANTTAKDEHEDDRSRPSGRFAAEIMEDLRAALEQFAAIAGDLGIEE